VRAARVLDAPVNLRSVGGRHIVEVTTGRAEVTLRQLAAVAVAALALSACGRDAEDGGVRGPRSGRGHAKVPQEGGDKGTPKPATAGCGGRVRGGP